MERASAQLVEPVSARRSGRLGAGLRIAGSLALFGFLCQRVDWTTVRGLFGSIAWGWWLASLAVYLSSQFVSAHRWRRLARRVGLHESPGRCLRLYFEGMFFGLCLPTSIGGDVWKAWRLPQSPDQRLLAGCTVLADRLAGLAALLVIGVSALVSRSLGLSPSASLACAVSALLGAMTASFAGLKMLTWLERWFWHRPVAGKILFKLLPFANHPQTAWEAILWSLVVQALNVVTVMALGRALGLTLPAQAYAIAVPLVSLATVAPISFNGVGVREGGLAWLLAGDGVSQELGLTLGFLWSLVNTASGLTGGLVYLSGRNAGEAAPSPQPEKGPDASSALLSAQTECKNFLGTKASSMTVSIVVPVYNERENITLLHQALTDSLLAVGRPYEMVLIDDGSTDGSSRALDELAARDPAVKVVHFRRNFGQTAAMNAGLHLASGDVIITLDADLQNDPADIPVLLAKLEEGYDLVHGWRKNRQDAFVNRKLPSKIANWLISKTTGFPVHDLGCTLKAMRREIAQDLQLYGEMHRFIPILAHWRGARCAEVVTRHHPRKFGTSKYGISRTFRVILDLITVKYMIQYLTSPMKLFGGMGLGSMFLGGLAGAATVGMKLWGGVDMTGNPLLMLTVFSMLAGMQFFVLGMLGEVCVRTYYESQNKQPYAIREFVNFDSPSAPLRRAA